MLGTQIVSVKVYVTSANGTLDGDDAQESTFSFEFGNWKQDLFDAIYDKAQDYVTNNFPTEKLICWDMLGMKRKSD